MMEVVAAPVGSEGLGLGDEIERIGLGDESVLGDEIESGLGDEIERIGFNFVF